MGKDFEAQNLDKLKENIVKADRLLAELNDVIAEINNNPIELTLKQNLVNHLSCRQGHNEPLFELKLDFSQLLYRKRNSD